MKHDKFSKVSVNNKKYQNPIIKLKNEKLLFTLTKITVSAVFFAFYCFYPLKINSITSSWNNNQDEKPLARFYFKNFQRNVIVLSENR